MPTAAAGAGRRAAGGLRLPRPRPTGAAPRHPRAELLARAGLAASCATSRPRGGLLLHGGAGSPAGAPARPHRRVGAVGQRRGGGAARPPGAPDRRRHLARGGRAGAAPAGAAWPAPAGVRLGAPRPPGARGPPGGPAGGGAGDPAARRCGRCGAATPTPRWRRAGGPGRPAGGGLAAGAGARRLGAGDRLRLPGRQLPPAGHRAAPSRRSLEAIALRPSAADAAPGWPTGGPGGTAACCLRAVRPVGHLRSIAGPPGQGGAPAARGTEGSWRTRNATGCWRCSSWGC